MTKKVIFLFLFGLGIFLLIQILMPYLAYKFWEMTAYQQNISLISPSSENQVLGVSIQNINNFPAFISTNQNLSTRPYQEFTLSIPSLKLERVKVVVDTNDFEQNLAHMPGTALPGERGNVFITGHSSLPQLFSSGGFKAIFAHLPEIKRGDEIIVDVEGQRFIYVVEGLKVVDPKEVRVINPPDPGGRYLTLMTCVPPGLYLKRLVVLAQLK